MACRIAEIDVHKKCYIAVVVCDVEVEGEYDFERQRFGSHPQELRRLSAWLSVQQVEEVVMESTVSATGMGALERYWKPSAKSEKVQDRCRERCIWRKPNRIVDARDGRKIFRMPSGWSIGWWLRN